MMAEDEDALYCDFAETYHILDFYSLPVETAARLAAGLRENSRIKSKLNGMKTGMDTFLLAAILDVLRKQLWAQTKGMEKPEMISPSLLIAKGEQKKETVSYSSAEEFERARREILR